MENEPPMLETTTAKPARLEIRVVLILVVAFIVAAGLYVLIVGSPTKSRAVLDSVNAPPSVVFGHTQPAPAPSPRR